MITAQEAIKLRHERGDTAMIERRINSFIKQWAPEDPVASSQFHTDLHMLIREMHRDAQKPITDTVHSMLALVARPPLTVHIPEKD